MREKENYLLNYSTTDEKGKTPICHTPFVRTHGASRAVGMVLGQGGHEEPSPRPPGLAWTQASALAPPPSGNESLRPLAGLSIPVISFENLNDQD